MTIYCLIEEKKVQIGRSDVRSAGRQGKDREGCSGGDARIPSLEGTALARQRRGEKPEGRA